MLEAWRRWRGVVRQRAQLGRLDDHLLRDIGVTAGDAQAEAARWPWDHHAQDEGRGQGEPSPADPCEASV
ncbi:MAG: DUF1127 domain-containing protein [Maritimibacter sp.]